MIGNGARPDIAQPGVTMRYEMKQKMFAFGEDFTIKDDSGTDRFFVDGRAFSLGHKLSFQDMSGDELAFIRQRLLSLGPTYEISRGGEVVATVKKKHFTLFRCKFSIDIPGPDDLEAQGSFIDYDYKFTRGEAVVGEVSKRWFSLRDTYGVEIVDGEDDVLILASTVVIDMVCHDERDH